MTSSEISELVDQLIERLTPEPEPEPPDPLREAYRRKMAGKRLDVLTARRKPSKSAQAANDNIRLEAKRGTV